MKKKMFFGGMALMLALRAALGAESMSAEPGMRYETDEYFQTEEFSLDAFGTVSLGKYTINHLSGTRIRRNARLGGGLGVNYFFTRNFGVGADVYSESTTGPVIDSTSANLIFRLPLSDSGFAPYVFGGGGRQFDFARVWFGQAGAGIECRFTSQIGAFLDARWVVPEETKYFGVGRLGVRFIF